jgi:adenosylhomocysteinase
MKANFSQSTYGNSTRVKYKVKDITLADWGRKEIKLAEAEMPGLMALREEFGQTKPLKLQVAST